MLAKARQHWAVNTPPLDIAALRLEWKALRQDLSKIPPRQLPTGDALRALWSDIKEEATTDLVGAVRGRQSEP